MSEINAEVVAEFPATGRRLALTTATGTMPVVTKAETIEAEYGIGEAMVVDGDGVSLVGPISATDARILALKIIDGDEQAATHPMTLLFLATAVAAFASDPFPEEWITIRKPQSVGQTELLWQRLAVERIPVAQSPGEGPQGRTAVADVSAPRPEARRASGETAARTE